MARTLLQLVQMRHRHSLRFPAGLLALSIGSSVALSPGSASACGGTFCDVGPQAMPVDQTGENVLFVMDDGYVEAHVQIQYTPGASRFAWIVPMPRVPEVSVGSAPLFAALLQGTVPTFGNSVVRDFCGDRCPRGSGGSSGAGGASSGWSSDAGTGPAVVLRENVGAFEVVALQGGTAEEVSDWLATNGYASTTTTPALLADYVANAYVFVAVKLRTNVDADEIHPLVFRFLGTEPCIPLKLTAVAAAEDMGVRAFFLGDDRVFPSNYKHVTLNPARLDWGQNASNYTAVVSRAVDSAVADGRAFVTEYAGPTRSAVASASVYSPAWSSAAFTSAEPAEVIGLLNEQGLTSCYSSFQCQMNHPLVLGLLRELLPPPPGVDDAVYYAEILPSSAGQDAGAFPAWDAARFAALVDERIVAPARHAATLIDTWPYLTRLFTTISPSEMTEDPEFVAQPTQNTPGVTLGGFSTQRVACNGSSGYQLPDGTQVGADPTGTWPIFSSLMPFAERIEEYRGSGAPIVLVDNTARIGEQLDQWNTTVGWPAPLPPPFDPSQCGSGGTTGWPVAPGSGAATGGAGGAGGARAGEMAEASGGCSTSGGRHGAWTIWLGIGMLGLARRSLRAHRR